MNCSRRRNTTRRSPNAPVASLPERETGRTHAYSYWVRGFAYLVKNDRDRAVQDYSRAIDLDPTPDRYYERGELHQSMSRYREAVDDFQKAAELYEAPHDARKDRYNAQMARVSAKTAANAWTLGRLVCRSWSCARLRDTSF